MPDQQTQTINAKYTGVYTFGDINTDKFYVYIRENSTDILTPFPNKNGKSPFLDYHPIFYTIGSLNKSELSENTIVSYLGTDQKANHQWTQRAYKIYARKYPDKCALTQQYSGNRSLFNKYKKEQLASKSQDIKTEPCFSTSGKNDNNSCCRTVLYTKNIPTPTGSVSTATVLPQTRVEQSGSSTAERVAADALLNLHSSNPTTPPVPMGRLLRSNSSTSSSRRLYQALTRPQNKQ
jgi:hypothetical protein